MQIIRPTVQIIPQSEGLDGIYKQIEIAGRVCYKSQDKITKDSAKPFVDRMIKSQHLAMLEHGTVYLELPADSNRTPGYQYNPYSKVCMDGKGYAVTTNYRVLVENGWLDDLQYLCEPTKYHERRITVKFNTQIAITREFNRHRVDSIAESSTRYCNYSKDKFGKEITVNLSTNVNVNDIRHNYKLVTDNILQSYDTTDWVEENWWLWANNCSELAYMKLIEMGWKPELARTVLPLDTNSELVHTAFISDWKHFFTLRCDKHAHPDAQYLATKLLDLFIDNKLITATQYNVIQTVINYESSHDEIIKTYNTYEEALVFIHTKDNQEQYHIEKSNRNGC